MLDEVDQAVN